MGTTMVVPVVGPVFCPFVVVGCMRNFLYELKGGQSWYGKPDSGRVCGPKGSPQGLLGRSWGRAPRWPKWLFFLFLSLWSFFFFLSGSVFLLFGNHHFSCSRLAHSLCPPTKFYIHLPHIPTHHPAPLLCLLRVVFPPESLVCTLTSLFFSPSRHANCSLEAIGSVFCTGFFRAGPSPFSLHTWATTSLTLSSFLLFL